ncbi:hypothetical protein ABPG72_012669 [Tetrahymena utriculariae]
MEQYLEKLDAEWLFEVKIQCQIKCIDYHMTKPWIAYSTSNNVVQIWDYERKICIKSMHSYTIDIIDHSKSMDIKGLKFLDAETLQWMFPSNSLLTPEYEEIIKKFSNHWLIIYSESKIFFYDYILDNYKAISPQDLEQKSVKIIQAIDYQYIAVGCGDGSIKIFDISQWVFSKTMREVHSKAVNFIIPYKQDQSSRPRLIVSSLDGNISCWNVDSNTDIPSFKLYFMNKKGKTSNDDENVISMTYDPNTFSLVTVTEGYVTVWNMMTSMELKRYKNGKDKDQVKEAMFFNHPCYGGNTLIFHSNKMELGLFQITKQSSGSDCKSDRIVTNLLYDLKNNQELDKNLKIMTMQIHALKPNRIFLGTNMGLYIINLNKYKLPPICFNHFFSTNHTVSQMKDFLIDDGVLKKMDNAMITKLRDYENKAQLNQTTMNFIYLHLGNQSINCTLFELQAQQNKQISYSQITCRQYQFKNHFNWEDSEILSSTSGKYISCFCRKNGYFEILKVNNSHFVDKNKINLLHDGDETLHFLSQLDCLYSGCCTSLVWHQYCDEFAALMPVNKTGQFIKATEKVTTISTGSIFNQKTVQNYSTSYSDHIQKIIFVLYEINEDPRAKVEEVYRKDSFLNPTKLFAGEFYGIVDLMTDKDMEDLISMKDNKIKEQIRMLKLNKCEFFEIERAQNTTQKQTAIYIKVGKPIIEPRSVYWNLNHEICIVVYLDFLLIIKQQNDTYQFFKSLNLQIIHGYFLEDLFFYVTEDSIGVLVNDFSDDILDIPLAKLERVVSRNEILNLEDILCSGQEDYSNSSQLDQSQLEQEFQDTIYPEIQKRPPGILKILMIYDYKLILINEKREIGIINLTHPFLKFCMFLQHNEFNSCLELCKVFDPNLHYMFAQMFIKRNALAFATKLEGLSLIDRAIIDLDHNNLVNISISVQFIQGLFAEKRYSTKQKKSLLTYLAVKMHQIEKYDEVNMIIQYGLQYSIFDNETNIILLSNDEQLINLYCAKYCGNLVVPFLIKKSGSSALKDKKVITDLWIKQMQKVLGLITKQQIE